MTPTAALLAELRLLRAMGAEGRAAATLALRSARLGRRPENPAILPGSTGGLDPLGAAASTGRLVTSDDAALKLTLYELDAAIVARGGGSIFDCKPRGVLSEEAERRLEAWAFETPRIHPGTPGVKPADRPLVPKPGRLVARLTGKLGGYASDIEDER